MSKHSAKSMEDGDTEFKHMDSDRQRQVWRKPIFDEKDGMKVVQFERYEREMDIVYEIKDIMTCVLEWEHLDPKTLLRRDPREEVLIRRMWRINDRLNHMVRLNQELFHRYGIIYGRLSNIRWVLV